ncbi:fused MFS/spermidine synthase [Sphingorhabdus pulchriflava]|nr:fused MFS/spermidine synthase [Sphingorhabdus pulchriflava]
MSEASGMRGRALFVLTILTGSFLLFLVQPMVARMALPRLGGAPAVWNSAMLVYQALLLAGYAYAHRLSREAPKRQAGVHLAVLIAAALWLPISLASFAIPADGSPIFWVPWLLLASIGPLFFAVAAQAPLMQRWFGLAGNRGEPYALYAASNLGSFGGLIAYPLLVEPNMPIKAQTWLWSGLYALLFLLVLICARAIWNDRSNAAVRTEIKTEPITWKQRLYWVALAAVPSGLMLSTTSHLTTDLMAMPLIWVIPLGLYLLSFTVAFADNRLLADILSRSAAFVLLLGGASIFMLWGTAVFTGLGVSVTLLFVLAVALHAEMYRTRPDASQLTEFYLMMSVGGVIGGFFCAIVAPLLFNWTWEHPILLLAAALLLPQLRLFSLGEEETFGKFGWTLATTLIAIVALGIGIYVGKELGLESQRIKTALIAVILIAGVVVSGRRVALSVVLAGAMLANGGWNNLTLSLSDTRMRSYFGTYTINQSSDASVRWLSHGTTMHGMQLLDQPTLPISYYGESSGVGIASRRAEELFGPGAAIGVVGLGTGTLACYKKPGQEWHFFEIDPLMVEIARDRKIFSFLEKCAPDTKMHVGDARLTLSEQPKGSFDLLAIDAFSSDSIPLHLLTKEAFAVYRRALKPNGILLVHISNRYIDLNPVIAAEAAAGKWAAALRFDSPPVGAVNQGMRPSQWIAMSPDPGKLAQLTGMVYDKRPAFFYPDRWIKLKPPRPDDRWTDDYASVLPYVSFWKIIR